MGLSFLFLGQSIVCHSQEASHTRLVPQQADDGLCSLGADLIEVQVDALHLGLAGADGWGEAVEQSIRHAGIPEDELIHLIALLENRNEVCDLEETPGSRSRQRSPITEASHV